MIMRKNAAVTICSVNYLTKAIVLFESYRQYHPEQQFYIVLVDRKLDGFSIDRPGLSLIWAEDLPIDNFLQYAFAFDIIELNTNVKPTALKLLLAKHDSVLYLDPDILILSRLDMVFDALENASVVVTPHCNTPILDGKKPDDLEFMRFGAFNLGFVGVSCCPEGSDFLDWWSVRCLEHGFYEPQLGLAVDQKWVNLAPSYFPGLAVLHDVGLNIAFWNLHERRLSVIDGKGMVNGNVPLKFIHFSSFNAATPEVIAQKQSRFEAGSRPDFEAFAREYAKQLQAVDSRQFANIKYGFDYFDDGAYVAPALRRFYAPFRKNVFADVKNPFEPEGRVRSFARKNGLIPRANSEAKRQNFHDMSAYKSQIFILLRVFRFALFILGPNRYFALMKYLAHISSLRNQVEMFGEIE